MMAEVPQADVVVTNPTRLAIALQYDSATMVAPQVVAKGRGFVALKIMALAQEAGVPRVENRELAQGLFRLVDVGGTIPTHRFTGPWLKSWLISIASKPLPGVPDEYRGPSLRPFLLAELRRPEGGALRRPGGDRHPPGDDLPRAPPASGYPPELQPHLFPDGASPFFVHHQTH
jgi:type III secretion system FlhB-like substrate exporter